MLITAASGLVAGFAIIRRQMRSQTAISNSAPTIPPLDAFHIQKKPIFYLGGLSFEDRVKAHQASWGKNYSTPSSQHAHDESKKLYRTQTMPNLKI